jgi:hypothetical protein
LPLLRHTTLRRRLTRILLRSLAGYVLWIASNLLPCGISKRLAYIGKLSAGYQHPEHRKQNYTSNLQHSGQTTKLHLL